MGNDQQTTTTELFRRLKTRNLTSFIIRNKKHFVDGEFTRHLAALLAEKKLIRAKVIEQAGIESSYGQSIFRGTRRPSRDKVLQLAIGFPLTIEETQRTLLLAKKRELHPKIERDAVIIFALNNKNTYADVQLLLEDMKLPLLGDEPD